MTKIFEAPTKRYHQLDNRIVDILMRRLTASEYKVLSVIVRATHGWKREKAVISYKNLMIVTGFGGRSTLSKALDGLEAKGMILIAAGSFGGRFVESEYRLNDNYDLDFLPGSSPETGPGSSPEIGPDTSPETGPATRELKKEEKKLKVTSNEVTGAGAPSARPGLKISLPDDLGNPDSAATTAAVKPPTFRHVFQTRLREAFCEWTELADPPMVSAGDKKLYGKRWRQPLRAMFLECGGDQEQTLGILESTCRYMIAEELTFDSPASMLRTFKSIRAKASRKANGSGLASKVEPFKWTSDSALWQQVIDDLARKKGATAKQIPAVRASLRTVGSSSEILAANEFVSARQMEAFIGELRRQLER